MDIFVARQPIFDTQRQVFAYELLFRAGPENVFNHADIDEASRTVIAQAFNAFGVGTLAQQKKLFINCTRKVLLDGIFDVFSPETGIVEVLETVDAEPEVLRALDALKAKGYTIALDDFVFRPGHDELVKRADVIKVDFRLTLGDERKKLIEQFGRPGLRFLAEKVETQAEFEQASKDGYSLFQGYFFARPEMISAREVPPSAMARMRMVSALMQPTLNLDELERVLKSDLALPVKLLKYLNSASFGWRTEISSLKHALVLMGDKAVRQWSTLVLMTMLSDKQADELVVASMMRARFCELIAQKQGKQAQAFELFLAGLFSTLDAILRRPMTDVLELLSVPRPLREALLDGKGELAPVYTAVRAYERGDWTFPALVELGKALPELPQLYVEAVKWAQARAG
ncbi:MAG: HDOD domain-containing protein [Deltaproteobacteria bacterium]|nr:HDOD domain-containing protein [Deltaproteobacteria bacterium]